MTDRYQRWISDSFCHFWIQNVRPTKHTFQVKWLVPMIGHFLKKICHFRIEKYLEETFCHFCLQRINHWSCTIGRSEKKSDILVSKNGLSFYRPFHTFISYSLHFWIKLNSTKLIWMCPEGQNPSQFTALEIQEYVILMLFPFKITIFDHFLVTLRIFFFEFRQFLRKLGVQNFWKCTTWSDVNMI